MGLSDKAVDSIAGCSARSLVGLRASRNVNGRGSLWWTPPRFRLAYRKTTGTVQLSEHTTLRRHGGELYTAANCWRQMMARAATEVRASKDRRLQTAIFSVYYCQGPIA